MKKQLIMYPTNSTFANKFVYSMLSVYLMVIVKIDVAKFNTSFNFLLLDDIPTFILSELPP